MGRGRSQRFKSRKKCSCSESESESRSHDHGKKNIMKQKSNSKSCKAISKLLLPEDMMLDILSWVPLKCLLNSARYVCKPWATTIGSCHFAEAHLHCTRSKPGMYVENRMSRSNSYFLDIKDNVNGRFERTDLGTPPRMGRLISTCDGILLLCAGLRRTFVVNPILKCWLRIPPLPTSELLFWIDRRQFTIARVPHTAKFKLFFVDFLKVLGANWYVFYVLRIGTDNSWKEICRKEALLEWCCFWQPVFNGGNVLYWITREGVIVMDVDKEITVGEYPLPPPSVDRGPVGTFLWMGNHLSCIVHKDLYTTYQIYILDIDVGKWTPYHEMGPFDYVAACGHELDILCVAFRLWINDQIIFQVVLWQRGKIFTGSKIIHFGYNVKTRQLTKIEGIAVGDFEYMITEIARADIGGMHMLNRADSSLIGWQFPDIGKLKWNVDGSMRNRDAKAGCGGVWRDWRDHNGIWIIGFCKNLSSCSIIKAEL